MTAVRVKVFALLFATLAIAGCSSGPDEKPAAPTSPFVQPPGPEISPSDSVPPRPNETLPPIVLRFQPAVVGNTEANFEVPNGTTAIGLFLSLNSSAAGPYYVSPGTSGGPSIALRVPGADLGQPSAYSVVFQPAAASAPGPQAVQGPFEGLVEVPAEGMWRLTLYGSGQNLQVDVVVTLTFGTP